MVILGSVFFNAACKRGFWDTKIVKMESLYQRTTILQGNRQKLVIATVTIKEYREHKGGSNSFYTGNASTVFFKDRRHSSEGEGHLNHCYYVKSSLKKSKRVLERKSKLSRLLRCC